MFKFKRSDWSITGNSGLTVTAGTPTIKIQVGGSYLKLPVRAKGNSKDNMLRGFGAGLSGGVSLEAPWTDWVNISGSPDFFPSNGLGPIYRRVDRADRKFKLNDLSGDFLVLGASGTTNFYGMNLCLGFWVSRPIEQCLADTSKCDMRAVVTDQALRILPGTFPLAILAETRAVGLFWGMVNTTDVMSGGVSAFNYRMSAVA